MDRAFIAIAITLTAAACGSSTGDVDPDAGVFDGWVNDTPVKVAGGWDLRVRTLDCPTLDRDFSLWVEPVLVDGAWHTAVDGCSTVGSAETGDMIQVQVFCSGDGRSFDAVLEDDGTTYGAWPIYFRDADGCEPAEPEVIVVERVR